MSPDFSFSVVLSGTVVRYIGVDSRSVGIVGNVVKSGMVDIKKSCKKEGSVVWIKLKRSFGSITGADVANKASNGDSVVSKFKSPNKSSIVEAAVVVVFRVSGFLVVRGAGI